MVLKNHKMATLERPLGNDYSHSPPSFYKGNVPEKGEGCDLVRSHIESVAKHDYELSHKVFQDSQPDPGAELACHVVTTPLPFRRSMWGTQ